MPRMQARVELVYFDAGGGHRAAAQALREMLALQGRPWDVRLVNLTQVLDPRQRFRDWTGQQPEDVYNRRLARGRTRGMGLELRLLQWAIRMLHSVLTRPLVRHWQDSQPDLVVSLIPNFNRVMASALQQARPGAPFATVITDLADLPPRFWVEPDVAQHVIAGTPHAVRQALDRGVPAARVSSVSGMLLRPAFYAPQAADRAGARRQAGLDPARPTAAVFYGGQGSEEMLRIARELPALQMVFLTGHNQRLAEQLRGCSGFAPRVVVGFTPEVPRWLHLADFFIGKPGPGAMSEALQMGLPLITFDNADTMPQERWNTRWVRELGVGLVIGSMDELPAAVDALTARLDEFRSRVRWIDNRAVFEVPQVLAELLQVSRSPRDAAQARAGAMVPTRGLAWQGADT